MRKFDTYMLSDSSYSFHADSHELSRFFLFRYAVFCLDMLTIDLSDRSIDIWSYLMHIHTICAVLRHSFIHFALQFTSILFSKFYKGHFLSQLSSLNHREAWIYLKGYFSVLNNLYAFIKLKSCQTIYPKIDATLFQNLYYI